MRGEILQRAAELTLTITWPDGDVTRFAGENLRVSLRAAGDWSPGNMIVLESPELRELLPDDELLPTRHVVLDVTLDLAGKLTLITAKE